ncbi:MAG: zinc ribbon domain-containing protein [Gammaproteobacteria bacterium]|nr:zinc ribbon domain-containing protein [Gammaproteobacteria bacterium]
MLCKFDFAQHTLNLQPTYKICPKCGHTRQPEDTAPEEECAACGLVFSKWLKALVADHALEDAVQAEQAEQTWQRSLHQFFFNPKPGIERGDLLVYLIIYLVFFAWGIDFISMDIRTNAIGESWFHNVNLVFHEAGHFLFIPFGRTGSILGGSLFQVLLPLLLVFSFLIYNDDAFAGSICLWWCGQSLMDVAPYIADARALQLPLLGVGLAADSPGLHDWANLLRPRGWLQYDTSIEYWVDLIGSGILLLALAWGHICSIFTIRRSQSNNGSYSSTECELSHSALRV